MERNKAKRSELQQQRRLEQKDQLQKKLKAASLGTRRADEEQGTTWKHMKHDIDKKIHCKQQQREELFGRRWTKSYPTRILERFCSHSTVDEAQSIGIC